MRRFLSVHFAHPNLFNLIIEQLSDDNKHQIVNGLYECRALLGFSRGKGTTKNQRGAGFWGDVHASVGG